MGLEINGNQPAATAGGSTVKPKVLGKIAPGESLFTVKNKDKQTGKLTSVEYYKDFNGDGEITENELSHVDQYIRHEDGSKDVARYKDKDGDGYSDTQTTYKYDKDGKLIDKKTTKEEDINAVKKREHMDSEVINRQMVNHKYGIYTMDGVCYPEQGLQEADKATTSSQTTESGNKALNAQLDKTILDDRIPTKTSLKRLGFEGSSVMDMNGGQLYGNKNGDSIRISGFHGDMIIGPTDSTCVAYKSADGKYQHEICYDPEGNPLKGVLVTENPDGSIETFEYEYDIDGNKHVTSYQKAVRD